MWWSQAIKLKNCAWIGWTFWNGPCDMVALKWPMNDILEDPVNRIYEQYLFTVIFHRWWIIWFAESPFSGPQPATLRWDEKEKFNEYISIKHKSRRGEWVAYMCVVYKWKHIRLFERSVPSVARGTNGINRKKACDIKRRDDEKWFSAETFYIFLRCFFWIDT